MLISRCIPNDLGLYPNCCSDTSKTIVSLISSTTLREIAGHRTMRVYIGKLPISCTHSMGNDFQRRQQIFSAWRTPTAYSFVLSGYQRGYVESLVAIRGEMTLVASAVCHGIQKPTKQRQNS